MTREEKIKVLQDWDGIFRGHSSDEVTEVLKEAIELFSAVPCENAVNRDDILNEVNRLGRNAFKDDADYDSLFAFVETLPPVQPKIAYPPHCGEDCRCGEGDDGEGCPYLNQNEECIIELFNR